MLSAFELSSLNIQENDVVITQKGAAVVTQQSHLIKMEEYAPQAI